MIANLTFGKKYRTWIEISEAAIKTNYRIFKKIIGPKTKLMGVVKSNAYGHGLVDFSATLSKLGLDWLGVDSITEGLALRRKGLKKPILVLGYTLPVNFTLAEKNKISLTISSFENLRLLAESGVKISVHIKIDTGMHRQGFLAGDLPEVAKILKQSKNIFFQGLYTHFAAAKKPDSQNETRKQITNFKKALESFKSQGFKPLAHAAASAGTLNYPESHFDMVRVGIGLYGLWPSYETKKALSKKLPLQPDLHWKTIISELKLIGKNEKVGYDFTEKLKRETRLAILPIGYWHGYWRAFSSRGHVLINNHICKVVGRVSMDMLIVDVTDAGKVKVGQEAVLLGKQGKLEITADELAGLANTTSYEIITKLNPLIKRFYTPA